MRVLRWGDDLAVLLPTEMVESLDLKEGDEIDIAVTRVRPESTEQERRALLAKLRKYRGLRPTDFVFDREEAHKRGS